MTVEAWLLDLMPEFLESDLPHPVVPEVPDWLLEGPLEWEEPVACDGGCGCGAGVGAQRPDPVLRETLGPEAFAELAAQAAPEPVRWAVPGVWEDKPAVTPSVGALVGQLQDLLGRLAAVTPAWLPEGQALGEAEALLGVQRAVRVLQLARTADVDARSLYEHRGFRSVAAWERSLAPDVVAADRGLARKLPGLPHLSAAVRDGRVSLTGAGKTATALGKIRPHLDRPDGLVEGVDGEALGIAVAENVLDLICRHHFGLDERGPARAALLATLTEQVEAIHTGGGSQADRIEQALVLLTTHLPVEALKAALEDVVHQVLPLTLEEREQDAQDKRAVSLTPNSDGTWALSGTLTPECGEQLFTALAAEARRDPANPVDTLLREHHRREAQQERGEDVFLGSNPDLPDWERKARDAIAWEPGTGRTELDDLLAAPAPCRTDEQPLLPADTATQDPVAQLLVPRTRSKRLHDAFQRLLDRYLSTGLAGVSGKVPVQALVTVSSRTLDNLPGAPPGRGASGRPLARSLIRRWWCDAHVTTLLMSHGWTPLGIVHSARTITGTELKAARVQYDQRCAADGCCPGTPDPLIPLVPHHLIGHAVAGRTSLGETLLVCETLHHDLHTGKRTVRLRDGRLINEHGFL